MNIKAPSATRFGGNAPESEPETKALTNLCKRNNFDRAIAFHSQGERFTARSASTLPL